MNTVFLERFGDCGRKTGHCAVTFGIGVDISGIEDVGKPNILVPLLSQMELQ
jgi:hypothetical protein